MTKQLHQEHNRPCNKAKRRAGLSVHITSEYQHRQEVKPRENYQRKQETTLQNTNRGNRGGNNKKLKTGSKMK